MDQLKSDASASPPPSVEELVRLELLWLGARDDHNTAKLLDYARRFDALEDDADRSTAHGLARRMSDLLLVVSWPMLHGAPAPGQLLHDAMRRRATAVNARIQALPRTTRPFPESRPDSISIDDIRPNPEKAAGGWPGLVPQGGASRR